MATEFIEDNINLSGAQTTKITCHIAVIATIDELMPTARGITGQCPASIK